MEKVANWRDEFKKDDLDDQDMDSAPTEESMDKDDGNQGGAKKKQAKGKDDSDDEGGQDHEKFLRLDEVVVDLNDLQQEFKGFNIDIIGKNVHMSSNQQV